MGDSDDDDFDDLFFLDFFEEGTFSLVEPIASSETWEDGMKQLRNVEKTAIVPTLWTFFTRLRPCIS
ncbi:hypothetical protein ACFX13_029308 [Malus domestica]